MDDTARSGMAPAEPSVDAKRPTLEDLARVAGVSRAQASIVMRGAPGARQATRVRVLQAAAKIGYRPNSAARRLARESSGLLGVAYALRRPFDADLIESLYEAGEAKGFELSLGAVTANRGLVRALESLLDNLCEAIVIIGMGSSGKELEDLAMRVPMVQIGRAEHAFDLDVVRTAGSLGIAQAVDHLVQLGHRSIVHVNGGEGLGSQERERGYVDAMRRNRRASHVRIYAGGATQVHGIEAARRILAARTLPTAVVAYNDASAGGIIDTLRRSGVAVPEDVSVTGYDDSQYARLPTVNLTTVAQDADSIARYAVDRLVQRKADLNLPYEEKIFEPHLIVRATSAPPRETDVALPRLSR